ncbi:RcnB family protein [Sphingomonas sp.]|uniref:RcnB family protein n=1 Tax=Sphingomonas sp. TaxID=28214 RepID=UPI0025CD12E1|nr:RcnB family protein [Sphingomonas sp.]
MKKFIVTALMAATILPSAAMAQNGELRRDRQDVRQERRDVEQARESGDPREVHQQRRELQGARQELRDDRHDVRQDRREWRRDDWRSYRNTNRDLYSRGSWNSPNRYRAFSPGIRITSGYYAPRNYINDYGRYRLTRPAYNQRWVRNYNDVLLVNIRTGRVIEVLRNFYL